jgi:hypothetical protein
MPRPKSGNPPWEAVAMKLPKEMLAELRRFADLRRLTISEVLREGLTLRMQHEGPVQEYNKVGIPTLKSGERRIQDEGTVPEYNGYTVSPEASEPGRGPGAALDEIRATLAHHTTQLATLTQALIPVPVHPGVPVLPEPAPLCYVCAGLAVTPPPAPMETPATLPVQEGSSYTVLPEQSPGLPGAAVPVEPVGEAGDTPGSSYGAFTAQVLDTVTTLKRATSAEIARVLSAKTKHAWQALQRLVKQGKVRQDGKYYLPA